MRQIRIESIQAELEVITAHVKALSELLEQPAPQPRLIEAVEGVLSYLQVGGDRGNPPLSERIGAMRLALAAERKLISDFKKNHEPCQFTKCDVCEFIDALDGGGK